MKGQKSAHIPQEGWFDIARAKGKDWFARMNISWADVTEVIISGSVGLVIGFLVKKFGRLIILAGLSLVIVMLFLHYMQFIAIEWQAILTWFGLAKDVTVKEAIQFWVTRSQYNLPSVILFLVGVLIGYKIG